MLFWYNETRFKVIAKRNIMMHQSEIRAFKKDDILVI